MRAVQGLTALVLAGFVAYIAAWYFGAVEGNFALLLFMATVVTGVYWLAERFIFLPRRQAAAAALQQQADQRRTELAAQGIPQDAEGARARARAARGMSVRVMGVQGGRVAAPGRGYWMSRARSSASAVSA